jgi:hypothetical protein
MMALPSTVQHRREFKQFFGFNEELRLYFGSSGGFWNLP